MMRKIDITETDSNEPKETIINIPAFTQEAEDAINDFLQKYPIEVPLRIVLK